MMPTLLHRTSLYTVLSVSDKFLQILVLSDNQTKEKNYSVISFYLSFCWNKSALSSIHKFCSFISKLNSARSKKEKKTQLHYEKKRKHVLGKDLMITKKLFSSNKPLAKTVYHFFFFCQLYLILERFDDDSNEHRRLYFSAI